MITFLRNRFHLLWRLRQLKWFRWLQSRIDFPVTLSNGRVKYSVLWLRDFSYIVPHESAERKMESCFEAVLSNFKPTLFLDVGANVGIYSWRVSNRSPETRVWMFEPDQTNAKLVRRTLVKNRLSNIKLHEMAVSNYQGQVEFLVDEASGATGSIEDHHENTASLHHAYAMTNKRVVPCVHLDSFIAELKGQRVLIKIDVEGAEMKVLEGAKQVLEQVRPIIFMECFGTPEAAWLLSVGYIIHDLKEGGNYLLYPQELKNTLEAMCLPQLNA